MRRDLCRSMRPLIAAGSKCRRELEGSLRQVAPAFRPSIRVGRLSTADIFRRWVGVLRVAHHPVDQALVERGDPCGASTDARPLA